MKTVVRGGSSRIGKGIMKRMAGQMARRGVSSLGRGVARSLPYAGAAMTAYDGARALSRTVSGSRAPPKKKAKSSKADTDAHHVVESKELEVVFTDKTDTGKIKSKNTAYTTKEINHTAQDPKAVYVGGATFIPNQVAEDICTAFVRYIARKAGYDVFNIMDVHDNAIIDITFDVLQYDGINTAATVSIAQSAATETWFDLAVKIKDRFILIGSQDKMLTFQRAIVTFQENNILETDYVERFIVNMNKAKVEFKVTQECNFQNVTTNEGGGTSTDVSVINPLAMTVYSGKGTGAKLLIRSNNNTKQPIPFSGTFNNGEISVIATDYTRSGGPTNTGDDWNSISEPVSDKSFRGTKVKARKTIMPGGIARTIVTSYDAMSWDKFWHKFRVYYFATANVAPGSGSTPSGPQVVSIGKHVFCGFEKIINSVGTTDNVAVKMEINNRIIADFHPGESRPNTSKFFQTIVTAHVPT